ncbi:fimbrial protein [Escherichia coli]|nr:fimbrial protein [Escherichia coli]EFG0189179.1 fimbrial protein [Escherichia coli]
MKYQENYFMKKTLIALTVAAFAAVSGSAMAWTPNFLGGGNVKLGGTLTPEEKVTPWEVQIGNDVQGLDGAIEKGATTANVKLTKSVPVLGIRTKEKSAFVGAAYLSPNIDYQGAVDMNGSDVSGSKSKITLVVKNKNGEKIGTMTAPFYGVGVISWATHSGDSKGAANAHAPDKGKAFFGGVPVAPEKVSLDSQGIAKRLISDIADNFDPQGSKVSNVDWVGTGGTSTNYSGYYAGGILNGDSISIKLDKPAGNDAIEWNAALPINIQYN